MKHDSEYYESLVLGFPQGEDSQLYALLAIAAAIKEQGYIPVGVNASGAFQPDQQKPNRKEELLMRHQDKDKKG